MDSQKNNNRWSALLVTIMITSIVLIVAIILLEKIIPYSRQIRNMQDSLQAYYSARGEVELGKLQFFKESGTIKVTSDLTKYAHKRVNIDPDDRIRGGNPITLKIPDVSTAKPSAHLVVAQDLKLPLELYLFENDTQGQSFGTNRGDPHSHLLSTFGGGMTFDLSGIDTGGGFTLGVETGPGVTGLIVMEFVYSSNIDENPFFWSIALDNTGTTNLMEAQNSAGQKLGQSFLAGQNCKVAHCYMKIRLANTLSSTLGVKIVSNKTIPDINGILIADGLSQNALYHARIIELLPVTQSI